MPPTTFLYISVSLVLVVGRFSTIFWFVIWPGVCVCATQHATRISAPFSFLHFAHFVPENMLACKQINTKKRKSKSTKKTDSDSHTLFEVVCQFVLQEPVVGHTKNVSVCRNRCDCRTHEFYLVDMSVDSSGKHFIDRRTQKIDDGEWR